MNTVRLSHSHTLQIYCFAIFGKFDINTKVDDIRELKKEDEEKPHFEENQTLDYKYLHKGNKTSPHL